MAGERARPGQPILLRTPGVAARLPVAGFVLNSSGLPRRPHVLLVEDSSLVVDALRILLEEHGYEVTAADSIESARHVVAQRAPDFALLDLTLPDGDGLDLARDWSRDQSIVVLALTGHADDATRDRCMNAGCHAVLVKPVLSAELLRQLAAAGRSTLRSTDV